MPHVAGDKLIHQVILIFAIGLVFFYANKFVNEATK